MLLATLLPLTPPYNIGSSGAKQFCVDRALIFFSSDEGLSIIRTF